MDLLRHLPLRNTLSLLSLALYFFLQGFSCQCVEEERSALLQLKKGLNASSSLSRLASWKPQTDCCSWDGITCNKDHVIGLDLSRDAISGHVDSQSLAALRLLEKLNLAFNHLQGTIPESTFKLKNLTLLDLSSNNFSGSVDLTVFQDLKNLQFLRLSDNNLTVSYNINGTMSTTFPQLWDLHLASCNLNQFPSFLKNQSELNDLDVSNNRISGKIPNWIWNVGGGRNLEILNMSHNLLESFEQPWPDISQTSLFYLDLHSNLLQGPLIFPSPHLEILDYSDNRLTSVIPNNVSFYIYIKKFSLSRNNLSGEIPSSICNTTGLELFDLSYNHFTGTIPQCLGELGQSLNVLALRENHFYGTIPLNFPEECNLRVLDLHGNQLEGPIPRSLGNCEKLKFVDLGKNRLSDTFPSWLANMTDLGVLVLRSNGFYGPLLPLQTNHTIFPRLHILDLSSNNFTGELSSQFFQSWKSMFVEGKDDGNDILVTYVYGDIYEKVKLIIKGQETELVKILTIFVLVDLSNNKFHGEISKSIGELKALHSLNISHNSLSGQIPTSLEELKQLESLDLSCNKLSGEIPWQLTSLTFLSVLNLSQNLLVGPIPQSRQFLTFSSDSFQGNLGLCGPPLSIQCETTALSPPSTSKSTASQFDWNFKWIGFGSGFGVGFGGVIATLVLWERGSRKYTKWIDNIILMYILP